MKKTNLVCAALYAGTTLLWAQQAKQGIIYEITLASMAQSDNPLHWDTSKHDVTYSDDQINLGSFRSTYAVGIGLWFGLHDAKGELLATCIVGPQPTIEFDLVSKDIESNELEAPLEPMTRVDVPFKMRVGISTVSDEELMGMMIAQEGSEYYNEDQALFYPNASKCSMFTRELIEDEGATLIGRSFTYAVEEDVEIVLMDADYDQFDPNVDNSSFEVASGFKPLDIAYITTSDETDSRLVPETTTLQGREVFTSQVVTSLMWATDDYGVPLAHEAINYSADDFTEAGSVAIRILPTAWAMLPRDGAGRLIGGETYYTLPSIKWAAKNLYPRSENQIALFVGTSVTGTPVATSPSSTNISLHEVQDMDVFWDLSLDSGAPVNDGVTYTAALRTKTPIDFDDDGSLEDEEWEVVDTVSFFYNREVNINGVIVTEE